MEIQNWYKLNPLIKFLYQSAKGWVIYICNKEEEVTTEFEIFDHPLQSLCARHADIFSEATGLPPQRSHDHHILCYMLT